MSTTEYPRWDNFKTRILESSKKALEKHTDICFEYQPLKTGRKVTGVKFIITKNKNFVSPFSLDDFLSESEHESMDPPVTDVSDSEDNREEQLSELMKPFHEACKNEFNEIQMRSIVDDLMEYMPDATNGMMVDILRRAYHKLELKASEHAIKTSRDAYLKGIIKNMFN